MKHLAIPLFTFSIHISTLAALPVKWDVDLAAQPPQVFTLQRPRGEEYEFEAVLKNHGKPFASAITNACIYWQTNGMENLYWSAPASVSNNVLRASWLPSMDPGATTVRGYIGDPGHIYAAAFQFRFIASPGPHPNALPLPTPVIDFARVTVLNPPWSGGGSGGTNTNDVRDIVRPMIEHAIESNEKTGTNQQIVRGATNDDGIVQIDVRGAVTAGRANSSNTADADAFGDAIHETYAKKTELSSKFDKIGGKIGPDDDDSASLRFGNRQGDAMHVSESGGAMFSTSVEIRGFGGATLSVESDDNDHPASITKDGKEVATEEYVDNHVSPPSPTLRLYDEVLDCWWIIKIVNGVMTREVE